MSIIPDHSPSVDESLLKKITVSNMLTQFPSFEYGGESLACIKRVFESVEEINSSLKDYVIAIHTLDYLVSIKNFMKNDGGKLVQNGIIFRYAIIQEPKIVPRKIVNAIMELKDEDI